MSTLYTVTLSAKSNSSTEIGTSPSVEHPSVDLAGSGGGPSFKDLKWSSKESIR